MRFKIDPNEWCGRTGKMAFQGTEYNLRLMTMEDLKILDLEIKEDKGLLEEILRREDLGDLEANWQLGVKAMVGIRKRQLNAICAEFLRKKKETPGLEHFAFSAVYHLLGPETLVNVREKAKELQEEYRGREVEAKKSYTPPQVRDRMCGDKVRHPNKESGHEQLESMRAHGKNTKGMAVYGPCPFCGFYHVGHKPKGAAWKQEKQTQAQSE